MENFSKNAGNGARRPVDVCYALTEAEWSP